MYRLSSCANISGGAEGHGGTTQNKYVGFFSHMNEKSLIDIGLNEVAFAKGKQGSYGSKDYLHNLELSTASLNPKFVVASHIISNCIIKTDSGNQTSISLSKKFLLAILLR